MKSESQVDAIMSAIPESFRTRWCGGERSPCACMGCVQIGNRAIIAEKITGEQYRGDPEHLCEDKLQEYGAIYSDNKLSREEWDAWMLRHPEAQRKLVTCSGKSTSISEFVNLNESRNGPRMTFEEPVEYIFPTRNV